MRAMVVVVVLPFAEFVVEDLGVVDDDSVEECVELFGVDAVGAFDFPVQPRSAALDVALATADVQRRSSCQEPPMPKLSERR